MFVLFEDESRAVYLDRPWDESLDFARRAAVKNGYTIQECGGVLAIYAPDNSCGFVVYTNPRNITFDCIRLYNLLAEELNLPAVVHKTRLK